MRVCDMEPDYESYLETWGSYFGEETEGEWFYWRKGVQVSRGVKKLTEVEYNYHWELIRKYDRAFYEAEQNNDDFGMQEALKNSFWHEFVLLI